MEPRHFLTENKIYFFFSENFVIMWKKVGDSTESEKFLALGSQIFNAKDSTRYNVTISETTRASVCLQFCFVYRMSVELSKTPPNKGSTLVIGLAGDSDAGQYVCQLGSNDQKEIKHTVLVRGKHDNDKS